MWVHISSFVIMTVVVLVGPGEGVRPDVRSFTRLLVSWNAAMGRAQGFSDLRLFVRNFRYADSWVFVYGNVHFTFIPSEFLGYLCPYPFFPYVYYYRSVDRRRRQPVRIRFFFERPRDWSGWDFFSSPEVLDLWQPWRPYIWHFPDAFWEVVVYNIERLRREVPLEQVARGDFNYRLRRSHFRQ